MSTGFKRTELHNSYLDIMASYGLLGTISLFIIIKALVSNWRKYLRRYSYDDDNIGGIIFSLLIVFGTFHIFYSSPRIYIIFFILFHITYLLSRDTRLFLKTNSSTNSIT